MAHGVEVLPQWPWLLLRSTTSICQRDAQPIANKTDCTIVISKRLQVWRHLRTVRGQENRGPARRRLRVERTGQVHQARWWSESAEQNTRPLWSTAMRQAAAAKLRFRRQTWWGELWSCLNSDQTPEFRARRRHQSPDARDAPGPDELRQPCTSPLSSTKRCYVKRKREVPIPSHKADRVTLISVSLALRQTPLYAGRPRI